MLCYVMVWYGMYVCVCQLPYVTNIMISYQHVYSFNSCCCYIVLLHVVVLMIEMSKVKEDINRQLFPMECVVSQDVGLSFGGFLK